MPLSEKTPHHGKQHQQKLKPYVVLQFLLKNTDENNVCSSGDIVDYLRNECEIEAERRSVCEDIQEINRVALMMEEECSIDEAQEMLEEDDAPELRMIVYDPHLKGYYVRQRNYDLYDMRLLAECVYASKFINAQQAKRLVDVICDFGSIHQAEQIKHDAFLTDRIKTDSKSVMNNIAVIRDAMSRKLDGQPHKPEKISFKYLKHSINDVKEQVERRKGDTYIVNPFALMINDGNYYLLAFDEKKKKEWHCRVDRMKDVRLTGIERECEDEFKKIDLKSYAQCVFSMYKGTLSHITLHCLFTLLDTMVERFGTKNVQSTKVDDKHFTVSAYVEVSDQFFGWLLGFGRKVKLTGNPETVEKFTAYLDKIRAMY